MHKLEEDWTAPDYLRDGWSYTFTTSQPATMVLRRLVADIPFLPSARGCGVQIDASYSEPGKALFSPRKYLNQPLHLHTSRLALVF